MYFVYRYAYGIAYRSAAKQPPFGAGMMCCHINSLLSLVRAFLLRCSIQSEVGDATPPIEVKKQ